MWIKRKKKRKIDIANETANTLEFVETNVNKLGEVPVVGVASEKMRKRVVGYTNPLKRLIKKKKS